ncbi:MAG: DNA-formamidopyrimidine glycosylase [Tenericutes bacterium]|nr:DNA-formamidopyrimidine glycosylase [Mycoplasmatota bacterium]
MPELPEVETVKETLKNFIIGRSIKEVILKYDKIIKYPKVDEFVLKIINQTFTDIRRYGKYLLFDLDDFTMVSHLRMEGKYYIRNSLQEITKHDHIIFKLDNGKYLSYHDVRKFGTMELVDRHLEKSLKSISVLGVEVNSTEFNVSYLYPLIKKSNRPIKSIMLDQHIVTGLGNIYVDETLYMAKIHPRTLGKDIVYYQVEKLIKSAKEIIRKAISLGGTTIRTYQSSLGVDGRFQNELNVHTLTGQKCKDCDDTIVKTRVGGRGTYFCPTCQREDTVLIVGITGSISSGKSMVASLFRDNNITVIDSDKIYKKLLKTDKIMYNELISEFGNTIIKNNMIDRSSLGNIVFNDYNKRKKLNEITHPHIMNELRKSINEAKMNSEKLVVLDIPLLIEANLQYFVDIILLVYVNKTKQIERLMNRDNINEQIAKSKIKTQIDLESKRKLSDIIIDNNGTKEETAKQFMEIYDRLRSDGIVN